MKTSKLIILPALVLLAASTATPATASDPGMSRAAGGRASAPKERLVNQKWTRSLGRIHTPGNSGFYNPIRDDYAKKLNLQPGKTYRLKDGDFVFRGSRATVQSAGRPAYHLWQFDPVRPAAAAARPAASAVARGARSVPARPTPPVVNRGAAGGSPRGTAITPTGPHSPKSATDGF